jgi:hypothetical protein
MTSTTEQSKKQPHPEQHTEIKLSLDQEAVLNYLYEHPQESHSTNSLAANLDDRPRSPDEAIAELKAATNGATESPIDRKRNPEDVERDLEILIFKGLVAGERTGGPGAIRYEGIHLTVAGERQAISLRNPAATQSVKEKPVTRPDHEGERP